MNDVCLRRMQEGDIAAVTALDAAAFPTLHWQEYMFRTELTNPVARYLVAIEGDRLLGFAGVHIILDEGHITNIAVAQDARGRGLGRLLTLALMQYASNLGVSLMTLEVRQSNLVAQRLYRSLGFMKVSVRKGYYEDNHEDAWLMLCERMPPADPDFVEPETLLLED